MNPLYNAAIAIYKFGLGVAASRNVKAADMVAGQRDTFSRLEQARKDVAPDGFDIWFHAASLGEFEQARPLIERLRAERPEIKMLLSFFSPSGYRVRHAYDKVDAVVYLPMDTPAAARRFVELAQPKMAIFVKYEFWGNILGELAKKHIPTYIISAIFRESQAFFKPWGGMFRKILRNFDKLYVQDENSRRLLASIDINNVSVAGDTRFDRVTDIMKTAFPLPSIEQWLKNSPFTLIVGSSWQLDEDKYIDWVNRHPDVRVIVAPHEFDKARIDELRARFSGRVTTWSDLAAQGDPKTQTIPDDTQVIIVDTFGLLSSIYRYGDVAYIGGGFGVGIHNINEAAVYGMPVIFGPNHTKFKEASDMIACGGAFSISDKATCEATLDRLYGDSAHRASAGKAAGDYVSSCLGATTTIYNDLFA
jgi:3-deoxy-D-manno-octulosonic-acid transferase